VLNYERENDVECWELKKWVLNGIERKNHCRWSNEQ